MYVGRESIVQGTIPLTGPTVSRLQTEFSHIDLIEGKSSLFIISCAELRQISDTPRKQNELV